MRRARGTLQYLSLRVGTYNGAPQKSTLRIPLHHVTFSRCKKNYVRSTYTENLTCPGMFDTCVKNIARTYVTYVLPYVMF